jgi:hypothetical protein
VVRRQNAVRDARLFKEGEGPGAYLRRHPQERNEIDGVVDIHRDARLSDDQRLDPAASRGIEMGVEAVVAETQRNGVRRRTNDRVRSELVVRRHDREGGGGPMRRQRSGDLGRRYQRNVAGHRHHAGSALADEQVRGGGDGAGMAFPRAFPDDAGAIAAGERCRDRIDRDDEDAGLRRRFTQPLYYDLKSSRSAFIINAIGG